MFKRQGDFVFKEPAKRAKVEVEIQQNVQVNGKAAASSAQKEECLWEEEEDDEFIFLSSQLVDKVSSQYQVKSSVAVDVSFKKFSAADNVQSSTQQTKQSTSSSLTTNGNVKATSSNDPSCSRKNVEKHLEDFFKDDDDDFELCDIDYNEIDQQAKAATNAEKPKSMELPETSKTTTVAVISKSSPDLSTYKKNKEKDQKQLDFLAEQLGAVRLKNTKLQNEYQQAIDKMHSKEGEVTMLRAELKNLKQNNDSMRLEKIKENENMKKEWLQKLSEMEKEIQKQKAELEFKTMEILKQRKQQNLIKYTQKAAEIQKPKINKSRKYTFQFKTIDPNFDLNNNTRIIDPLIFEIAKEDREKVTTSFKFTKLTKTDKTLLFSLNDLQSVLAHLQALPINSDLSDGIVKRAIETCLNAAVQIENFASMLDCLVFRDEEDISYSLEKEYMDWNLHCIRSDNNCSINIYDYAPIYKNDKVIIHRRIIAAVSLIAKYSKNFAKSLFISGSDNSERSFIQILTDVLYKLCYTRFVYKYFGIVLACAYLIDNIAYQFDGSNESETSQLYTLLRAVVYCRPDNSTALLVISQFFLKVSNTEDKVNTLSKICWQCEKKDFFKLQRLRLQLYKKNSCSLQIYAALLETCVSHYQILSENEQQFLAQILLNTINFLRRCYQYRVTWVLSFRGKSQEQKCYCYSKIANSFALLLHVCIKNWLMSPCIDLKTIHTITHLGSLLLSDIYQLNFRNDVISVGGHYTKTRIKATYDWLMQYVPVLNFGKTHMNALNGLQLRCFIDEPLKPDEDKPSLTKAFEDSELVMKDFLRKEQLY